MSNSKKNPNSDSSLSQSEQYLSGGGETYQPKTSDTDGRSGQGGLSGQGIQELELPPEFQLIGALGRGGMGVVYLVKRDTGFGEEELALKTILPEHLGNQSAIERFVKEVETLKGLKHDHIVTLRDFRKYQGYFYFLMEYISGSTLDIYLRERGPLSVSEAVRWFTPLAEAVDYAHRKGVIHRDIKPSNVMLGTNDNPYLLDFGIARQADSAHTQARRLGAGTWEYMAPEQFDDDRPTSAMDVYSFGATLYFALVGRAPFSAVSIRKLLMEKEAGCPAIEIAGLERPAVEALRSSMDVDAAKRPESCGALLKMLQTNSSSLSIAIPQSSPSLDQLESKQVHESDSASELAESVDPAVAVKSDDKEIRYELPSEEDVRSLEDFKIRDEFFVIDSGTITESPETNWVDTPQNLSYDANATSKQKSAGTGWFRWLLQRNSKTPQGSISKVQDRQGQVSSVKIFDLPETLTNSIGMQFRLIKPGTFLMGEPPFDLIFFKHDREQHQVMLTRPYYLGVYPVTQDEYVRVMGNNPSYFRGKRRPVDNVMWKDAMAFLANLNARASEKSLGRFYRLPTEAEWEYACRAGKEHCFFWESEKELEKHAWYDKNSGGETHPVGGKLPNAWELYDMRGNVWEWCSDWLGDYPEGAVTDPVGPSDGFYRVSRGGSWYNTADHCNSVFRPIFGGRRSLQFGVYGFRVALSASFSSPPDPAGVQIASPSGEIEDECPF
jgi:formylglycine-generating enzyme required for sulfatase activity